MTWCDFYDAEAPRPECSCRACYRAREALIPEALRKFLWEKCDYTKSPYKLPGFAIEIVRIYLSQFCAGKISLDEGWVEIIKQLVTQNDKLFEQLSNIEMLKPVVPHLILMPEDKR